MITTPIKIETDEQANEWQCVDWKDAGPEVFEAIDSELSAHGLVLMFGENGDDNYWFKIVKKEPTMNTQPTTHQCGIEFEGVLVTPTKEGLYYCPYNCGDPRYPRKQWKTEKGFRKHMENCPASPSATKRKADMLDRKKAESDAKAQEAMKDCPYPYKIGDTIFYVREIITAPTHKSNGSRMVRVRYEAEKRFEADSTVIKSFGYDFCLYINNGIRGDMIFGSIEDAAIEAKKQQEAYDKQCEFAARCR